MKTEKQYIERINKLKDEKNAVYSILVLLVIYLVLFGIFRSYHSEPIKISQETGDSMCLQITNNSATVATSEYGKLICTVPSYDHTQNIIVRSNNDKGGQN